MPVSRLLLCPTVQRTGQLSPPLSSQSKSARLSGQEDGGRRERRERKQQKVEQREEKREAARLRLSSVLPLVRCVQLSAFQRAILVGCSYCHREEDFSEIIFISNSASRGAVGQSGVRQPISLTSSSDLHHKTPSKVRPRVTTTLFLASVANAIAVVPMLEVLCQVSILFCDRFLVAN